SAAANRIPGLPSQSPPTSRQDKRRPYRVTITVPPLRYAVFTSSDERNVRGPIIFPPRGDVSRWQRTDGSLLRSSMIAHREYSAFFLVLYHMYPLTSRRGPSILSPGYRYAIAQGTLRRSLQLSTPHVFMTEG